jgi:hypothetical protein
MKGIGTILTALFILIGFSGCSSESRKVTLPEPGVYKGVKDPLLAKQKQQELINRFKLVQTDR